MKINIILVISLLAICLHANAAHHEQNPASLNGAAASKFMETLLTDRETADSLLHPDFDFLFPNVFLTDKKTEESHNKDIGKRLESHQKITRKSLQVH